MLGEVTIDRRFHGPPDSGNGGYTCGRLAAFVDAPAVEVSLRMPPPLERPLAVEARDGGAVLLDGEAVVAEAVPGTPGVDPPPPVGVEEAEEASARSPFRVVEDHAFPTCFVCGPERAEGDGLRIMCGATADGTYAATWIPDASLTEGGGTVAPEHCWAALDCPTAVPVANRGSVPPIVLARMTAELPGTVEAGRTYVLVARRIEIDGRKRHAAAALYDERGGLVGLSRALWIELRG